jgi:hypothetical protein
MDWLGEAKRVEKLLCLKQSQFFEDLWGISPECIQANVDHLVEVL